MNTRPIIYAGIALLIITGGVYLVLKKPSTTTNTKEVTSDVQPKDKTITIAAFGDSLTAGYGVNLEDSYPTLLQAKLDEEGIPVTVINMGVSGETTSGGLERVSFVLDQNPDIVLLGLGANDMLRGLPVPETKKNLKTIIENLQKGNTRIFLLGMESTIAHGLSYKQEFDEIYKELAKEYSLPFVPFFLEDVAFVQALNTGDGIHPNRSGYQVIVNDNIIPILLPYIKKEFK